MNRFPLCYFNGIKIIIKYSVKISDYSNSNTMHLKNTNTSIDLIAVISTRKAKVVRSLRQCSLKFFLCMSLITFMYA